MKRDLSEYTLEELKGRLSFAAKLETYGPLPTHLEKQKRETLDEINRRTLCADGASI